VGRETHEQPKAPGLNTSTRDKNAQKRRNMNKAPGQRKEICKGENSNNREEI